MDQWRFQRLQLIRSFFLFSLQGFFLTSFYWKIIYNMKCFYIYLWSFAWKFHGCELLLSTTRTCANEKSASFLFFFWNFILISINLTFKKLEFSEWVVFWIRVFRVCLTAPPKEGCGNWWRSEIPGDEPFSHQPYPSGWKGWSFFFWGDGLGKPKKDRPWWKVAPCFLFFCFFVFFSSGAFLKRWSFEPLCSARNAWWTCILEILLPERTLDSPPTYQVVSTWD